MGPARELALGDPEVGPDSEALEDFVDLLEAPGPSLLHHSSWKQTLFLKKPWRTWLGGF